MMLSAPPDRHPITALARSADGSGNPRLCCFGQCHPEDGDGSDTVWIGGFDMSKEMPEDRSGCRSSPTEMLGQPNGGYGRGRC